MARDRSGKEDAEPSQVGKFIEAARELGCDEDEAAFDESLRKVAGSPVDPKRVKRRDGEGADPKAGAPGVKGE